MRVRWTRPHGSKARTTVPATSSARGAHLGLCTWGPKECILPASGWGGTLRAGGPPTALKVWATRRGPAGRNKPQLLARASALALPARVCPACHAAQGPAELPDTAVRSEDITGRTCGGRPRGASGQHGDHGAPGPGQEQGHQPRPVMASVTASDTSRPEAVLTGWGSVAPGGMWPCLGHDFVTKAEIDHWPPCMEVGDTANLLQCPGQAPTVHPDVSSAEPGLLPSARWGVGGTPQSAPASRTCGRAGGLRSEPHQPRPRTTAHQDAPGPWAEAAAPALPLSDMRFVTCPHPRLRPNSGGTLGLSCSRPASSITPGLKEGVAIPVSPSAAQAAAPAPPQRPAAHWSRSLASWASALRAALTSGDRNMPSAEGGRWI